jgi:hypothetical protein
MKQFIIMQTNFLEITNTKNITKYIKETEIIKQSLW